MNPDPAPPALLFLLLNARGLTSRKLLDSLYWLREKGAHAAVFTETHLDSDPADLLRVQAGAGAIWPGAQFFYTPGSGHTEGVAIVLGPGCHLADPVRHTAAGDSGRILRIDLTLFNQPVSIVGVYGPAQQGDRAAFYDTLLPQFLPTDGRALALAGDFNTVLSPLDCFFPPGHQGLSSSSSRSSGAQELRGVMEAFDLRDLWREANPSACTFTHWSPSANSGARLDRWLLSSSFLHLFPSSSSNILPAGGLATDHLPVTLQLRAPASLDPRGTGILSFPILLLNMPQASAELEAVVSEQARILGELPAGAPMAAHWDKAKALILSESWKIFRKHRRERQRDATTAERAASTARHNLLTNVDPSIHPILLATSQAAADTVTKSWQRLCNPTLQALRFLDDLFGDTSSYYFHSLTRAYHPPIAIRTLNRPGRGEGSDPEPADLRSGPGRDLALQYAVDFYSSDSPIGLFQEKTADAAAQDTLLSSLSHRLPVHRQSLAEGLDGNGLLTAEDLEYALSESKRGSCPGHDGLPYEFYRAFKALLIPPLLQVFNRAFQDGTGHHSPLDPLLRGVICLLPKPGQPSDELTGYRPITLLNCDVKLVLLVMSNRLQRPLDFLIDITQSAFLRGRDISDNVRYHLGLRARLQELGLPAWLLHSDLTKAYDSVDRNLLTLIMQAMGLREDGIIRWTRILSSGTTCAVRVNGFFTTSFPVRSGLAQGSALSCQQWDIACQVLVSYLSTLQSSGRLASFPLPSGRPAPPILAFADDTTVPVLDPDQLTAVILPAFQSNAAAGNPSQSQAKTVLQHITGPQTLNPPIHPTLVHTHAGTGYRILDVDGDFRHLGVPLSHDHLANVHSAFCKMHGSMAQAGKAWQATRPNLLGRAHVGVQCIASKAIYQFSFHKPHVVHLAAMQKAVNTFVARSARSVEESPIPTHLSPSAAIALLPRAAGGLGVTDLTAHSTAMRAKPCWKIFGHAAHPWADLFQHEIGKAAPLPSLPPGAAWIVTNPTAPRNLGAIITPSTRDAVAAFFQLRFHRILDFASQDPHSVLLEHTFHNILPAHPAGLTPASLATPEARTWLRLKDVRAAFLGRSTLPPPQQADVALILAHLPPAWSQVVKTPHPLPSTWHALHPPGTSPAVFEGPDPMDETRRPPLRLWEMWPSGVLIPLRPEDFARNPAIPSRPALVFNRQKPKSAWTRSDYEFQDEQEEKPKAERREIVEAHVIGIWDELQLDPRVWGIKAAAEDAAAEDTAADDAPPAAAPQQRQRRGRLRRRAAARAVQPKASTPTVSLLSMTVKAARLHLGHLNTLARQSTVMGRVPGYAKAGAVWPLLWPICTTGDPPPTATETQLRLYGIAGMEERWRQGTDDTLIPADQEAQLPFFLRPTAGQTGGRISPADRAAARGQAHVLRPGFVGVWKRLLDAALPRPFRITCWRMMHGCLGVNAYLLHVRRKIDGYRATTSHLCSSPACTLAGRSENLTHAFMECPEVAPVIDWLLGTWERLTADSAQWSTWSHVPRSARAILADDPAAWPDRPPPAPLHNAWNRLRVNTLGAIWSVRCARDEAAAQHSSFARRAVTVALDALTGAIERDWMRTQQDLRTMNNGTTCTDWFRGGSTQMKMSKFEDMWMSPAIFCQLVGPLPIAPRAEDKRTMELLIRPGVPLPLPA